MPHFSSHSSTDQDRSAGLAITVFPLIVLAAFACGFFASDTVAPYTSHVSLVLGVIMFGMGLTLTPPDFSYILKHPLPVFIGVVAQFLIMPLLAIGLATLFRLPPELAIGVVLVGCAPGGTSSNVITYLARGDVALSVTMTSISTLLASVLTPLLTLWLAGQFLPVSAGDMAISIIKMVLIPVIAGLIVRLCLPVDRLLPVLPWISVFGIAYVVVAVVSKSADALTHAGLTIFAVVFLHNGLGYLLGYITARLTGGDRVIARTTSVEVGMQNSGLAATLATTYFSPLAALPAAVFSVWHNISGGVLAFIFRHYDNSK